MPILNSALTRSAPRSAMRLASSWTVIASGTIDVADLLLRGPDFHVVALFLFARALERGEAAGAAVVFAGQSAGDGQLAALAMLVAAAAGARGLGALGRGRRGRRRAAEAAILVLAAAAGRLRRGFGFGAARPRRRPRRRLRCGFFLGLAIFLGAAALLGAHLLCCAVLAAAGFLERGAGALPRPRAASAPCRSLRCGDLLGFAELALRRGAARLRRFRRRASGASATRAWALRPAAAASPGRPRMRRFLTSTTTVFERPWLKLCLTLPVSTVRLMPSGGRVPSFGLSGVSAILFLHIILSVETGAGGGVEPPSRTAVRVTKSAPPRERVANTRRGSGIGQGDMYHIVAPKGHRQDSAALGKYHPPRSVAAADPPGLVEALRGRPRRLRRRGSAALTLPDAGRGLDPFRRR